MRRELGNFYTPRQMVNRGIIHQTDILLTPRTVFRVKVLVFENYRAMAQYWKRFKPFIKVSFRCSALVRSQWRVVSPTRRYWAVVGFVVKDLCMEVVCHEAVHLGCQYTLRMRRHLWRGLAKGDDEELIAYPAGAFARLLNKEFHNFGLYPVDKNR